MSREPTDNSNIVLAAEAMNTRFEVVLPCAAGPREPRESRGAEAHLRAAGEQALEEVRHWHRRLSWFDPGSFVSHINANAAAGPVACDPEFFGLLRLCSEMWRASGGAFDPTVAALMRASGFRGSRRSDEAIAEARRATGFGHIELDDAKRTVRFTKAGIGLDFGAIGKGWALDRAAESLRGAGVRRALMHGGTSSVVAIGEPEDARGGLGPGGWPIAIDGSDRGPGERVVVHLRDLALGVSAPAGRVVHERGVPSEHAKAAEGHGHVLDPRTGRSAGGAVLAAVIADSCAVADAWSTALLVEGGRPAGMPGGLTSIVRTADGEDSEGRARGAGALAAGWQIEGPHAATLIRSSAPKERRLP